MKKENTVAARKAGPPAAGVMGVGTMRALVSAGWEWLWEASTGTLSDCKCRVVICPVCSWGLAGTNTTHHAFCKRFRSAFSRGLEGNPGSGHRTPSVLVDTDQRDPRILKNIKALGSALQHLRGHLTNICISMADNCIVMLNNHIAIIMCIYTKMVSVCMG